MTLELQRPPVKEDYGLEPKFVDARQKHRKIVDGKPVELEAVLVEGLFLRVVVKHYLF